MTVLNHKSASPDSLHERLHGCMMSNKQSSFAMAIANYEISTVRGYPMFRFNLLAFALLGAVAACSPAPDTSSGGARDLAIRTAAQVPARLEITADTIKR